MASSWGDCWGGSAGAWLATWDREAAEPVVLVPPLSFSIESGRAYIDISSGKAEISIESGRKRIDIG